MPLYHLQCDSDFFAQNLIFYVDIKNCWIRLFYWRNYSTVLNFYFILYSNRRLITYRVRIDSDLFKLKILFGFLSTELSDQIGLSRINLQAIFNKRYWTFFWIDSHCESYKLQCADKAQEHGNRRNIRICSDSRAAITALNGTTTTLLLVWECFETLNNLATENRVTLLWISGYSGTKGNEISDRLAKLAARENFIGPELVVGVSSCSLKKLTVGCPRNIRKNGTGLLAVNRARCSWAQLWTLNELWNYASSRGTKSRSLQKYS